MPNLASRLRLVFVTDDGLLRGRDPVALAVQAVDGGATMVQLRLKNAPAWELAELGRRLLAAVGVPVVVNDRLDVALAIGAHGVHLGPDDVPVPLARRLAPPGFLVGASVGTPAEAPAGAGADYWGVGPWRTSATKADAGAALGPEGFRRIRELAAGRPCVAIGGVRPEDVSAALAAGAAGVAVVSGILASDDVGAAARRYVAASGA